MEKPLETMPRQMAQASQRIFKVSSKLGARLASKLRLSKLAVRCAIALSVVLLTWSPMPSALAFNNPELLPDEPTVVIDLARILNDAQEENLNERLTTFEDNTGWKLRVLTQFDQNAGPSRKGLLGTQQAQRHAGG